MARCEESRLKPGGTVENHAQAIENTSGAAAGRCPIGQQGANLSASPRGPPSTMKNRGF